MAHSSHVEAGATSEHMASLIMSGNITKSLLIVTGAMGAGKTSVLGEASDMPKLHNIAHAAVDVDALGLAYLPAVPGNDEVMYGNLRSVCDNYPSSVLRNCRSHAHWKAALS